jgi:hypothetical protein
MPRHSTGSVANWNRLHRMISGDALIQVSATVIVGILFLLYVVAVQARTKETKVR